MYCITQLIGAFTASGSYLSLTRQPGWSRKTTMRWITVILETRTVNISRSWSTEHGRDFAFGGPGAPSGGPGAPSGGPFVPSEMSNGGQKPFFWKRLLTPKSAAWLRPDSYWLLVTGYSQA